jgi:hypothetical protein
MPTILSNKLRFHETQTAFTPAVPPVQGHIDSAECGTAIVAAQANTSDARPVRPAYCRVQQEVKTVIPLPALSVAARRSTIFVVTLRAASSWTDLRKSGYDRLNANSYKPEPCCFWVTKSQPALACHKVPTLRSPARAPNGDCPTCAAVADRTPTVAQ